MYMLPLLIYSSLPFSLLVIVFLVLLILFMLYSPSQLKFRMNLASQSPYLVVTRHAHVSDQENGVFSEVGDLTLWLPANPEFLCVIMILLVKCVWAWLTCLDFQGYRCVLIASWPSHTVPLFRWHIPLTPTALSPLHLDDSWFLKAQFDTRSSGMLSFNSALSFKLIECLS